MIIRLPPPPPLLSLSLYIYIDTDIYIYMYIYILLDQSSYQPWETIFLFLFFKTFQNFLGAQTLAELVAVMGFNTPLHI